jgi:hypothetical protein
MHTSVYAGVFTVGEGVNEELSSGFSMEAIRDMSAS